MAIKKVADPGVAANENELARGCAAPKFLEKPEKALDGHVDDVDRRLLAGGEMDDMGDVRHGACADVTIGDRPETRLDPIVLGKATIVAERADARVHPLPVGQQPIDEMPAHFARGTRDQDQHRLLPGDK